jgi:hypothetical protein
VVPSLDLIVVRNGQALALPDRAHGFWSPAVQYLLRPVVEAITEKRAYPPSPVIGGIHFTDSTGILRKALGSDNWPITWGDDDRQYAAYGDGNGFEPYADKKLSQGFALIEGSAGDIRGVNIRSATGERMGNGAKGPKASGMLMVDGVLYVLVRNASNAQLGWSSDHGQTWTWSDWKFDKSFGCPTFLNFGRNYAEARDEFVYIYSHDSDSAYEPADGVVLARVPQKRIKEQAAFEFFQSLDASGSPVWTKSIGLRGQVFSNPGGCYRTSVSYNAGLKRYLICQIVADKSRDTRFTGGFGIYESPQPWGPWATVYYTNDWDVGPGETNSLPTKWMSADGRTVHLVFSGDDHFSVRKATFVISQN